MKKFKELLNNIIEYIKEEKVFLICSTLIFIIFIYPVDYYIITGGGTKEIGKRVVVEDAYQSEGSLNMCFVHELQGTLGYYLLSYVIPGWDLDKVSNYKYNDEESLSDVEFRNDLSLKESNSAAVKWAFKLAKKEVEEVKTQIYVTAIFKEYPTELKVQDEIISIENKTFKTTDEYRELLSSYKPGDTVDVEVIRKKKKKLVKCRLYDLEGSTILGVLLESLSTYKTDPEVEFNFKSNESGPSAGLITTLDLYNKLTKKDITKSLDIAATGTIEYDGTIGAIGGVKYKLMGAAHDKMDIFLVPAGENYEEALKVKKDKKLKIKIISIENIEDAINVLNKLDKKTA